MYKRFVVGLLLLAGQAAGPRADDIDIYRRAALGADHLLLAIDLDSASAAPACNTLADCGPPYLPAEAYQRLLEYRLESADAVGAPASSNGAPVSRLEVSLAELSSVLSRPQFDALRIALLARQGERTELLLPFETLAGARGRLEAALWSLPARLQPELPPRGSPLALYAEWLRLTRDGGLPPPEGACPRLYSLLLSHATPERWADLDSAAIEPSQELPASALASPESLLGHLHGEQVDLFGTMPQRQAMTQSWLAVPEEAATALQALAGAGEAYTAWPLAEPGVIEQQLPGGLQDSAPLARTLAEPGVLAPAGQRQGQVFLPLFADPVRAGSPGNLKKLALVAPDVADPGAGTVGYVDALGNAALEPNGPSRGQLTPGALTFWTQAEALPEAAQGVDGNRVLLGGAGQLMALGLVTPEVPGSRQLYLEPPAVVNGTDNALVPLAAQESVLAAAPYLVEELAAADANDALDWLRWLRGADVDDEDGDGDTTELRHWLLGALIHSRPAVINYGPRSGHSADNPLVHVIVGSNDGVLHAFENTTAQGEQSGRERFGFIPRAMLALQRARRGQDAAVPANLYGVDGSPVPWLRDRNGDGQIAVEEGDRAWVFFGLRRGGTHYYALDVSDPDEAPVLRWQIDADPAGEFAELGLGFAEPVVGRVRFATGPRDVLILAGGYHGGRDAAGLPLGKDGGSGADTVGNALFVIDAQSGELLWKAVRGSGAPATDTRFEHPALSDSFPSRPAALRDGRGIIYRLYVGDSGGAVWRVDLPPGSGPNHRAQHWSISKFAQLDGAAAEDDRRFFHPPDLVRSMDAQGTPFNGVLIASGNRAAAGATGVRDGLFYLRDYAIEPGPAEPVQPTPITYDALPDHSACESGADTACDADSRGWRLMFPGAGEKGLSSPLTEAGEVFFTTFVPPTLDERCAGGAGHSLLYRIRLDDGSAAGEGGRATVVGEGLAHAVLAVGDALLLPGLGLPADETDSETPPRKLIPQRGSTLYQLYWREPGRDDL